MPIKQGAQEMVDFLNEMFAIDPEWIKNICEYRPECNGGIVRHPTVQAFSQNTAGFLGLINGFYGVHDDGPRKGFGAIGAKYCESGKLLGFMIIPND